MNLDKLTRDEAETMAGLLRRAIVNNQLNLHVASPYENEADWKRDGWAWNDRHDGNAVNGDGWHVEVCEDVTDGEDDDVPRYEVQIYVDDESLCFLACSMRRAQLDRAIDLANRAIEEEQGVRAAKVGAS